MKLLILCGGPSSEYEVSINSAKNIVENLNKTKYEVSVCVMNKEKNTSIFNIEEFLSLKDYSNFNKTLEETINIMKSYDFVFIAMHGEFGEDGELQEILEKNSIKYQGSNSISSKLCFDKNKTNDLVSKVSDIKIPLTIVFTKHNYIELKTKFVFPGIIKPNALGSSVGVRRIDNTEDLLNYEKDFITNSNESELFLYQEYISGIELSCGVLESRNGNFTKLPAIEIVPEGRKFFDYESKYSDHGAKEICPSVSISKDISDKITELSIEIHKLLRCKTYSRSDYIFSNNRIYYLETNTLPGMTSASLLPKEADIIGITYPNLLDFLIINSM